MSEVTLNQGAVNAGLPTLWRPWAPMGEIAQFRLTQAEGFRAQDDSGRWYIDANAGALNAHLGHGNARLTRAAQTQFERLAHFDLGVASHPPAEQLANDLALRLPQSTSWHTSFVNSGSEATELAIRIALDYWKNLGEPRRRIISMADSYHGSTLLSKNLTRLAGNDSEITVGLDLVHFSLPSHGRALREANVDDLLSNFARTLDAGRTAAVMIEAFLNVGGGVVLPAGFLAGIADLCEQRGVLLIVDEVFCGFGRTGKMFGFEHDGVTPNIVTYSKGLSSGYIPIAGVSADARVYASYLGPNGAGALRYGHTTGGHAVACAVAHEVLEIIDEDGLVNAAANRGAQLLSRLSSLEAHPSVADVRGLGLVVAIEFSDELTAAEVRVRALRGGAILRQQGKVVMLVPPLIISEDGIEELVQITVAAVNK